jgi:hypothetical protein
MLKIKVKTTGRGQQKQQKPVTTAVEVIPRCDKTITF